jgi:hypothetical protein
MRADDTRKRRDPLGRFVAALTPREAVTPTKGTEA